MSASPNLKLPYIDANQNQKSVTHNEALRILDALVNLHVASATLSAPPGSPADGQCWIVASGGSGAWLGKDLNVAAWQDGAWIFYAPNPGFVAYVDAIGGALIWNGTAWVSLLGVVTQLALNTLGIGTVADPANPLSAKLNAALFAALPTTASPAGTGHVRVALSKQAAANVASLLYQDNYSGRAEIGLVGDDNFHFKVSPDGSTFYDAIVIAAANGAASFLASPTAPTPSAGDASTRLATTAYADRAAAANFARTQVNDAAYTVLPSDRTVAVIALTAARSLALPAASAYPQGSTLTLVDESGACSATMTLTVARAGTDTINGAASAVLSSPYAYLALESNGSNKWTVIDQPSGVVSSLNGGPLAGFRNRLINGNFAVNQRGQASNTALAAGAYGHDRWKGGATGCIYTFAQTTPDTSVNITAGTLLQIIEAATIEGGTFVLSWTGSATARVYQGSAAGSYAASPVVARGLAAGANTTVEFSTGTLGVVQFEAGPIATPFERRPIGGELALCQRYFATSFSSGIAPAQGTSVYNEMLGGAIFSSSAYAQWMKFPVTMRASPTITFYSSNIAASPASGQWQYYNSGWNNGSGIAVVTGGSEGFQASFLGSFTAGSMIVVAGAWTASAEL